MPRGLPCTWQCVNKFVYQELKIKGYNVEIFVYNQVAKVIDGTTVDNNIVHSIPYDYYNETLQSEIDKEVSAGCQKVGGCVWRSYNAQNGPRVRFSELQVVKFLKRQISNGVMYDVVIMIADGICPIFPINANDVEDAIQNTDTIYTTDNNDPKCGSFWKCKPFAKVIGYTDGLYVGSPESIAKVFSRYNYAYEDFRKYRASPFITFEFLLKKDFEKVNVKRKITKLPFLKVRAGGNLWQSHQAPLANGVNLDKCSFFKKRMR
eukprot:g15588.t1